MQFTRDGLPNTCSKCGRPVDDGYWFANNTDEARSGAGICKHCIIAQNKYPEEFPLQNVSGIGYQFAWAFAHFGIYTLDDLAKADAKSIKEEFSVYSGSHLHKGRVARLIKQAKETV
jgi:hypothetical protein